MIRERTQEVIGMKRTIQAFCLASLMVLLIAIGVLTVWADERGRSESTPGTAEKATPDVSENVVGEPIVSGFVFIDGRYIEPPYVISRKGYSVLINDILVEENLVSPTRTPVVGLRLVDVMIPEGIDENSDMSDAIVRDYLYKKRAYIQLHSSQEERFALISKSYRDLPCVEKVDSEGQDSIRVTCKNGSVLTVRLVLPKRRPISLDRNSLLQRYEKEREFYETGLKDHMTFFLFGKDGGGGISGQTGNRVIQGLIDILQSDEPSTVKMNKMSLLFPTARTDYRFGAMIDNATYSAQLESRLKAIEKSSKR